ncbi:uncharacterized protein [Prorops nasuta]
MMAMVALMASGYLEMEPWSRWRCLSEFDHSISLNIVSAALHRWHMLFLSFSIDFKKPLSARARKCFIPVATQRPKMIN